MPIRLLIIILVARSASLVSADEPTRSSAIPSNSEAEIFERFIKECVTVTPGQGVFPEKAVLGSVAPASHERSRQEVVMSRPFRMCRYETTQELYKAVMGNNPSRWQGPRNSVEMMTFRDAKTFCDRLTEQLRQRKLIEANETVSLPTSDQWEYCCRAASTTAYCFGDAVGTEKGDTSLLNAYAWHTGNAAGNDPAVGVLKANAWEFCDVHGYLWEFVLNNTAEKSAHQQNGSAENSEKCMIRGGSWRDDHSLLTSSSYLLVPEDFKSDALGFRCVIVATQTPKISDQQ